MAKHTPPPHINLVEFFLTALRSVGLLRYLWLLLFAWAGSFWLQQGWAALSALGWGWLDGLAAAVMLVFFVLALRDVIFAARNPNRYLYTVIVPALATYFMLKITFVAGEMTFTWQLAALAGSLLLLQFPLLWAAGTLWHWLATQRWFVALYHFSKYLSAATSFAVLVLLVLLLFNYTGASARLLVELWQSAGWRAIAAAVVLLITPLHCFLWYAKILRPFNANTMRQVAKLAAVLILLPLIWAKMSGVLSSEQAAAESQQITPIVTTTPVKGAATTIAPLAVLLLAAAQGVVSWRRRPPPLPCVARRRRDPNQELRW